MTTPLFAGSQKEWKIGRWFQPYCWFWLSARSCLAGVCLVIDMSVDVAISMWSMDMDRVSIVLFDDVDMTVGRNIPIHVSSDIGLVIDTIQL
jgi:hypothetical protein